MFYDHYDHRRQLQAVGRVTHSASTTHLFVRRVTICFYKGMLEICFRRKIHKMERSYGITKDIYNKSAYLKMRM